MTIAYRNGTTGDVETIDRIFRASFFDAFAHLYRREDLGAFLAKFTHQAWAEELGSADFAFRLAEVDGMAIGYLKLGPLTLPVERDEPALELRQLYILQPWHGSGARAGLMDWALAQAGRQQARQLFLTVYTDNQRAKRFYERYGFVAVGRYDFMVGSHADEDIIMRLTL